MGCKIVGGYVSRVSSMMVIEYDGDRVYAHDDNGACESVSTKHGTRVSRVDHSICNDTKVSRTYTWHT